MASDEHPGVVRDLMVVERPVGTHLSKSSTPGGLSALARSDDNGGLVAHASMHPADGELEAARATGVKAGVVVGSVATLVVVTVVVKVMPLVKNRLDALWAKRNRKPKDAVEVATHETTPEPPHSPAPLVPADT